MTQNVKKTSILCLIAYGIVLLALINAEALAQQTTPLLQPQGLNYVGIYALRQIDPNLTGAGVKFAVICRSITYIDGEPQNDYRPNIKHNCFKGKNFGFYDQGKLPSGISTHSTAICSILVGEDPNAFNLQVGQFYYQGAAPQAEVDVYEFWHFLINNVFTGRPPNADIITAGMGSHFPDWWTRGIESLAEHYGLIIVAGIGNGLNAYDPVLYPAASANVIGVGVVNSVNTKDLATNLAHFALAYPQYSSFGPTIDGRCKPDIIAPGNCLAANPNDPNSYELTGNWSSFSTPVVAGTIGLLVQKAKQEPKLAAAISPNGGNCVIKAILLNSAKKLPYWHKGRLVKDDDHYAPLDFIQGAGMLNAIGAYKHLIAGPNKPGICSTIGWDLNLLRKNENPQNVYQITIPEKPHKPETQSADKFITATLVWNRHYQKVYPFKPIPQKDANLRLELWAIDPSNPSNDYLLDYSDSQVDNVEHIYCRADPNYSTYQIVVLYSNADNSNQMPVTCRYGLAWNVNDEPNDNSIFWYDLNADGLVNKSDLAILVDNWLIDAKTGGNENYLLGDINADGTINADDFQIFLDHIDLQADWYKE